MGRSRDGLTTKLHALFDAKGRPVRLALTPGQAGDAPAALGLLEQLAEGATLLAGKAYDTDAIRAHADERGAWACIPPTSRRKGGFAFSRLVCRPRNLVERFFNRLKHFRGIATRYDRRPDSFLAALKLASVRTWLASNESASSSERQRPHRRRYRRQWIGLRHPQSALEAVMKCRMRTRLGECDGEAVIGECQHSSCDAWP